MKKKMFQKLKQKGWTEEEIKKANKIIEERKKIDKSRTIPTSNKAVFWTIFVVMIIMNFLISLTLIPFLLVLNNTGLDFIIIVIGLTFGILFSFMANLAHISKTHHTIAGIVIPLIAVINFFFMTYLANVINEALNFTEIRQNPATIGLIYIIAFIAPFILDLILRKYFGKE